MPFHRFEDFESSLLTPHLSSGKAPVIEGTYMYFCLLHKNAGTGSELHYHPNELLIFPLRGKINAIVGTDRRIVSPGTFVHAPAYARHSMKATEDSDCQYLYIKDKTWTVVGLAENEPVPAQAMSVDEVNRKYRAGELAQRQTGERKSQAIVSGLHTCYYPLTEALDAPRCSAQRESWVRGERLAFGFFDVPKSGDGPLAASEHEIFAYVLAGRIRGELNGAKKPMATGDIMHIPRGAAFRLQVQSEFARYVMVCSTAFLEHKIDSMTPQEQEHARLNLKAG